MFSSPPSVESDNLDIDPDGAVAHDHADELNVVDLKYVVTDVNEDRSPSPHVEPVGVPVNPLNTDPVVLPSRARNPPARLGEWIYLVNRHSYACVACLAIPDEPDSYQEAMASPEKEHWLAAMQEEYDSLIQNDTWTLEELPVEANLVKCRWVYKLKLAADGSVSRYKARLVAKGFTQRKGVDFEETFSPVVKFDSIRTVLSVAAAEDLNLTQFDVCTAYLNGLLRELIFMQQPIGFEVPHRATNKRLVCQLLKALYGLKQGACVWNRKFDQFLKAYDLVVSDADCCVYVSKTKSKLILCIWVDDGLVCSTLNDSIEEILSYMGGAFRITQGLAEVYVGLHITRDRDRRLIHIDQRHYLERILRRFNHEDCHSVSVPSDPSSAAQMRLAKPEDSPITFPYRECIGCLQFAQIGTRFDISYAISNMSRFNNNPTATHVSGVKRILKYIKGTLHHTHHPSGFLGGPQAHPTPLFCDNQSTIRLVQNPVFHQRTKHIDIRYHKIRDAEADGQIAITYVATDDQLADIMTKPLSRDRFEHLRGLIGSLSAKK